MTAKRQCTHRLTPYPRRLSRSVPLCVAIDVSVSASTRRPRCADFTVHVIQIIWQSAILNGGPTQTPRCDQKVCGFIGSLLAFKTMYQLYLVDTFFELLISTNYLFVLYLTIHIHILLIKTIFPLVYIIIFWIYWIYSTKLLSDNLFDYDKIDQTWLIS